MSMSDDLVLGAEIIRVSDLGGSEGNRSDLMSDQEQVVRLHRCVLHVDSKVGVGVNSGPPGALGRVGCIVHFLTRGALR